MQFSNIIGQEELKEKLIQSVRQSRVSHAQLFLGPPGTGKLALALAYARYINCKNRTETDSCGVCSSCLKFDKLVHPDLHFVFPTTTTKNVKKDPESELFMEEWREFVLKNKGYVDTAKWYDFLGVENKQGSIYVRDASTLLRKLSLKPYEGEYKMVIFWMVEKMNIQTANKLLKQFEEPTDKTLFLLLAEEQEQILTTVKSRTILVKVPPIRTEAIQQKLTEKYNSDYQTIADAAIVSHGNWIEACHYLEDKENEKFYFQTFQQWMRLCFRDSIPELIDFSNNIKSIGRERQKDLLNYALDVYRNSLLYNNQLGDLVRLPIEEKKFVSNFAPFVNPSNMLQMCELVEDGIRQIERNGYASLIFLDISLKIVKLIKMK